jgi:hypothetical protein
MDHPNDFVIGESKRTKSVAQGAGSGKKGRASTNSTAKKVTVMAKNSRKLSSVRKA